MVEIRACETEADKRKSVEIYNAVCPRDAVTMDDVAAWEAAMRDTGDFLALLDGEPAGSGAVAIMPTNAEMVFALITVLGRSRRRGAGSALYRAASEWARERGRDALETRIAEDDDESLAFASRRRFEEVSRNGKLVLDLAAADIPAVEAPPGVDVVTLAERPDLDDALYEIYCEAMPDIPGVGEWTPPSRDHFVRHHLNAPGARADAIFVALADGEPAGYAKFRFTDAQPGVAAHQMTGVKRAHRGRGIAGALKRAQLAWAKANAFERVETENETRNEPILRLNSNLGFRPAPGYVFMRGPLASI